MIPFNQKMRVDTVLIILCVDPCYRLAEVCTCLCHSVMHFLDLGLPAVIKFLKSLDDLDIQLSKKISKSMLRIYALFTRS